MSYANKIQRLIDKGVRIPVPDSVVIGDEVDPDRISGDNVVIHAGCRIFGRSTLILQGARLGYEGPVTAVDCQIGPNVQLYGGYFKGAVFLSGASAGSGSHVREGTIFEEEANIAHTVGLKQTILFPFVTLGSLINFCDCLMAGGTDRKNHSEVGSSYIHFNFTPNQDKATASLLGDVPRGVMLNQSPIFSRRAGRSGRSLSPGIRHRHCRRHRQPQGRTAPGSPDIRWRRPQRKCAFCGRTLSRPEKDSDQQHHLHRQSCRIRPMVRSGKASYCVERFSSSTFGRTAGKMAHGDGGADRAAWRTHAENSGARV